MYCTECDGTYGSERREDSQEFSLSGRELLGALPLPPAGVHGRAPADVLRAAAIWNGTKIQSMGRGVCPRCSAPIEQSVVLCDEHDATNGQCASCNNRYATAISVTCTNCLYDTQGVFILRLLVEPAVRVFLLDHRVDPLTFDRMGIPIDEEIISTDPFRGRFTLTVEGDGLTLLVDDGPSVLEVTTQDADDHQSRSPGRTVKNG